MRLRSRPRLLVSVGAVLCTALVAGCSGGDDDSAASAEPSATTAEAAPATTVVPLTGLTLEPVATGLSEPVDVAAPLDDGLLFVVERIGLVRTIEGGKVLKKPFADLRKLVKSESIEQGLLGLTFHQDYPKDRRVFFFHSIRGNDNVLVSYRVAPDGRSVEPDSRKELLRIDKGPDAVRHNAGTVRFGPDRMLYLSVGDAAAASVNGQNPKTLPGSVLRIDVDAKDPYGIPADNPFADGRKGAPEVWWYGLRNPWRISIDAPSGNAYIADVGQDTLEEVNVVRYDKGGLNFGWPLYQSSKRFYKGEPATPLVFPVLEVRHDDEAGGCSITGGEVYRGRAIPEYVGYYFYADWCRGWIRSFLWNGSVAVNRRDWSDQLKTEMVSAFGHDAKGELLVVDYGAGTLWRVVPVRSSARVTTTAA